MRGWAALLVAGLALCACADPRADEAAARRFVFQKLSMPDRPVVVGPAVVQQGFAVVDFTRGAFSGGRALVRKEKDGWTFLACGGAPMKRRPVIERAGVPDGAAGVLVTKLLREESRLDPDRMTQIERWTGLGAPTVACPEPK